MFLHERFALFVGLGPIKLEEAVVARRFSLGTSTTTGTSVCSLGSRGNEGRGGEHCWSGGRTTYGFRPWGFRGFCLGSVGSYGTFGVDGAGDQRAVT